MNVKLSTLASYKLTELLKYLESEWSVSSKKKFIALLDAKVNVIKSNPASFVQSGIMLGLHKCVITKQTTLLYKYDSESIYIVTIFDNRQDPQSVEEEINKLFG